MQSGANLPNDFADDSVQLSGQALIDFVVQRAADVVEADVRAREDRRLKYVGAGVALLGVIGAGILNLYVDSTIRQEVKRQLDDQKKSLVAELTVEFDRTFGDRLRGEFAYLQMVVLASRLEMGDGFTEEDVSLARTLISEIATRESLVQRDELRAWLEKIVDAMAAAGRADMIDYIVSLPTLKPVIIRTPGIGFTLMEHYARRLLIGDEQPNQLRSIREEFNRQVEQLDPQNKQNIAVFYRILVASRAIELSLDGNVGTELERAKFLDSDEKAELLKRLGECVKPRHWGRVVNFDTSRLAESCTRFLEKNSKQLVELEKVAPSSDSAASAPPSR